MMDLELKGELSTLRSSFSIFDPKIHLANFLSVETLPTAVVAEIQKGQPQKIGE